ncbi:MarR family winged helix-turn-helix transcriptional regulator [Marinihelvus fidelis]|uniref:MarR family winged helix-turn-helix transcriptional regulator n=1 Tax=Marinihelvus fidelis TaxID=2613842 RepID=UPI001CD6BCB0|nr:MarR family transcriptional regulator [Marinihelvus fidelis]
MSDKNPNTDEHSADAFALENFLPYRLSLLSNTISGGISNAYRKVYDLSVTEWRVLAILGRYPGLTATEVTERGAMDKVAVSRAVNRLELRSLVERGEHGSDRRRVPLVLSEGPGKALFNDVMPRALAYEKALLASLTDEERATLERLVGTLQAAAEQLGELGSE